MLFSTVWIDVLLRPMYNLLIFFANLPGHNIGIAVILLTIFVKVILYPFSIRAIKSQVAMKKLEPELAQLKKDFPDKKQQTTKTFELYQKYKVNPFSGCFLILIQLPFILALYRVFLGGFLLRPDRIYSFVHYPLNLSTHFLGIDLAAHSIVLAILAAISQYIVGRMSTARMGTPSGENMQAAFAKSMQMQTLYVFPLLIGLIAFRVSGAVALYWITSNLITTAIEYIIVKYHA